MTKKALFCVLFVSLLGLAKSAHSQAKPDFSGTWKQSLAAGSEQVAWLKSYINKIDQRGDTVKVTTMTLADHGEVTSEYTFVIGKEQKSQDHQGDEITTLAKWEGNALVFETVERERDAIKTTKTTWILSADGRTFTKTIHRSGPKGESEQKYILEKQ